MIVCKVEIKKTIYVTVEDEEGAVEYVKEKLYGVFGNEDWEITAREKQT